jgi:DNA-binding transcriptional regulator YdaS (Cro superfamily)
MKKISFQEFYESMPGSKADFAREIGVTWPFLWMLYKGKRRPKPETALKIQAATGGRVTAAGLLGIE